MKARQWLGVVVASVLTTGCNFFSDTESSPAKNVVMEGSAVAGRIHNARVVLHRADSAGRALPGSPVASADTDSNGHFALSVPAATTGPVVLEVQNGTYSSESDNSTQNNGTLTAVLPGMPAAGTQTFVTPLSHIQTLRTRHLVDSGAETSLANALNHAQNDLQQSLGDLGLAGQPLTSVAPDFTTPAGPGFAVGVALGVLEQLRQNLNVPPGELIDNIARDLSDGTPDGREANTLLQLAGAPMSPAVTTTSLAGAANDYAGSTTSVHHDANIPVTSVTESISTAAIGEASVSGQVSGSSGAIAPMIVGNHIYIYFAGRQDGLVRLDMTDPQHPVADHLADLNTEIAKTLSGVGGVIPVPIPVGGKQVLFLYNYSSNNIVAINATDNVVMKTGSLDIAGTLNFSGAGGLKIAGGIADGKRNVVWLATADGLMGVDPVSLAKVYLIPQPANTQMDENIGGDPSSDVVFAPHYQGGGMVLFNLAERKAYVQSRADWDTLNTIDTVVHDFGDIDQAAVDTSYRIGVVTSEFRDLQFGVVSFATPTGATGDTGVFTPLAYRYIHAPAGVNGSVETGAAIDSAAHILFAKSSWSTSPLIVAQLDDPAKGVNWQGFAKARWRNTSDPSGAGDPHAIGAFNIAGRSFGFSLAGTSIGGGTSRSWDLMVVDLQAFLDAPANADGILNDDPMLDANIVRMIAY
ncbi:hypothetical protein EV700_3163 [Fluviicoccus keumensis]|uniref:Uncharacterized protein n=1 Tax=Fluviicoccus keumensis TaxID=1435465 RepID=A0A4Q7YIB6_9GAMM|nr:hypothetical protein [Fluviicoccus keumensis]RZU36950.1 hypothetical protein EV700_3163 [Fluviicoccus keumensis]